MKIYLLYFLYLMLFLFPVESFAQNENSTPVLWKKRVARLVDTRDTLDRKGNVHRKEFGDTSLSKLLIEKVLKGDLVCYRFEDNNFNEVYKINYLKSRMFFGDTLVSDKRHNSFRFRNVTKFRILEEWEFDPIQMHTEIRILALAPIVDESYREPEGPLFWLKYQDVKPVINEFRFHHPENNIQKYLWDDYFKRKRLGIDTVASKSRTRTDSNSWNNLAIRNIILFDSGESYHRDLYTVDDDVYGVQTIGKIFYDSIAKRKLFAYKDSKERLKNILPSDSIYVDIKADTSVETNKQTGLQKITISKLDMNWEWFTQYNILEQWSYDLNEGKINAKILGIQPRLDKYSRNNPKWPIRYKNLFWVRYEDVSRILRKYNEYHPLNNLSTALWQSYFSADNK